MNITYSTVVVSSFLAITKSPQYHLCLQPYFNLSFSKHKLILGTVDDYFYKYIILYSTQTPFPFSPSGDFVWNRTTIWFIENVNVFISIHMQCYVNKQLIKKKNINLNGVNCFNVNEIWYNCSKYADIEFFQMKSGPMIFIKFKRSSCQGFWQHLL